MFGALIGAGASLVGGIMGRNSARKDQRNQNRHNERVTDPQYIRDRYEAAGFNPLLGLNGPVPLQTGLPATGHMGQAIADAGMIAGDYLSQRAEAKSQVTKLTQENAELQKKLREQTLRPVVGGIFGGGQQALMGTLQVPRPSGPGLSASAGGGGTPLTFGDPANFYGQDPGTGESRDPTQTHAMDPLWIQPQDTTGGNQISIPVGPDIDEFVMGVGIAAANRGLDRMDVPFLKFGNGKTVSPRDVWEWDPQGFIDGAYKVSGPDKPQHWGERMRAHPLLPNNNRKRKQ